VSGTTSLLESALVAGIIVTFTRFKDQPDEQDVLKSLYDELAELVGNSRAVRLWIHAYDLHTGTHPKEAA
jgi:hypothetical protein